MLLINFLESTTLNRGTMSKQIIRVIVKAMNGILIACLLFTGVSTMAPAAAQNNTATTTPSGTNVALGKSAVQSSTLNDNPASYAVDGNTDGAIANNSVSSTQMNAQAWLEVDLGSNYNLTDVRIWNRTDAGTESRLSNFYVLVSDAPFTSTDLTTALNQAGVGSYLISGTGGRPSIVNANRSGRYVRVQLVGTDFLSLAEVEVYATGQMQTQTQTVTPTLTITPTSTPFHVGIGKYNDTDANIQYTGSWIAWNGSGYSLYNDDEHHTNQADASATLYFNGQVVAIGFLGAPGAGTTQILLDGVVVTTLNTNRSTYQIVNWNSSLLSDGDHTLVLRVSTGYTELDYIEVVAAPQPLGVGKHNDTDPHFLYSGSWVAWSGSGYPLYNNDEHHTNQVNASASLVFNGQGVTVGFLGAPGAGVTQILIDEVVEAVVNTNRDPYQGVTWDSALLPYGIHTLVLRADSGYTELDYVEIKGSSQVVGIGKHNDTDSRIQYSGSWVAWSGSGYPLYNNDEHHSNQVGANTTLSFDGSRVTVGLLGAPGAGETQIFIDGIMVATVNSNRSAYQSVIWDSALLSTGIHTLILRVNNSYTELDFIEVKE